METESLSQPSAINPKRKGGAAKGNKNAQKHGVTVLKNALKELKRHDLQKVMQPWRKDLIRDLGGDVSTKQDAIISLAIKTKVLLDTVDAWLFQQESLINKRKKSLIPAAKDRQIFADALARYISMLGLQRKTKLTSLSEILSKDDGKPESAPADGNGEAG